MQRTLFRLCLLNATALAAFGSPGVATDMQYIFVPTGCPGAAASFCVNSPGGLSLTYNFTNINNSLPASAVGSGAFASNGYVLGAEALLSLTNASAGQYDVLARIQAADSVTFPGVSAGFHNISFTYQIDGSFNFLQSVGFEQLQFNGGLTAGPSGPFFATGQSLSSTTNQSIDQSFTFTDTVQFTGNPVVDVFSYRIAMRATTQIDFSGSSNITGTFTSNFLTTARLTSVTVDGNSVHAYDSSGQDIAGVPEPATFALVFLALAGPAVAKKIGPRMRPR